MIRLFGFFTQNTMKTVYTLEALGLNYEFQYVDLMKGEQRNDEFLKINPLGKVPALQHNDNTLFESNTICRYVASIEESDLFPSEIYEKAKVEQWMDFFTNHLGRWLNTMFYENIIKEKANIGSPDQKAIEEAVKFAKTQFGILDNHLKESKYLASSKLSIADITSFAYVEQVEAVDFSLEDYPNVKKWYNELGSLESIRRGRAKVQQ